MKKFAITAAAYFLPLAAFADDATGDSLADFFNQVNSIINLIVPFIVGIAVFVIIWGIFTYIAGAGDEEKRAKAKSFIVWGIIGVFLMLAVWGLVNILVNSFDLTRGPVGGDKLPKFDTDLQFEGNINNNNDGDLGGGGF